MKTLYEYLLEDLDIKSLEDLVRLLNKGIVLTNFEFKTPGRGFYVLTMGEAFLKLDNALNNIFISDPVVFKTQYPLANGFQAVVEDYATGLSSQDYEVFTRLGGGVLELSNLDTSLDYLLTKFSTFDDFSFQKFVGFLEVGIVYFYDPTLNILILSGIETFLKFWEATGPVITVNNLLINAYLPNGLTIDAVPA